MSNSGNSPLRGRNLEQDLDHKGNLPSEDRLSKERKEDEDRTERRREDRERRAHTS